MSYPFWKNKKEAMKDAGEMYATMPYFPGDVGKRIFVLKVLVRKPSWLQTPEPGEYYSYAFAKSNDGALYNFEKDWPSIFEKGDAKITGVYYAPPAKGAYERGIKRAIGVQEEKIAKLREQQEALQSELPYSEKEAKDVELRKRNVRRRVKF